MLMTSVLGERGRGAQELSLSVNRGSCLVLPVGEHWFESHSTLRTSHLPVLGTQMSELEETIVRPLFSH